MPEPKRQVVTAALVVVPGPGGTVTFVRQERGPYAGFWLLPGGKVEFGDTRAAGSRVPGDWAAHQGRVLDIPVRQHADLGDDVPAVRTPADGHGLLFVNDAVNALDLPSP